MKKSLIKNSSFLNWRLYGPFMLAKTKNAVKAAERAYIVANDNTYDISADDLEKIKDCFNNADFVYDGREAYPHCGFTKDYAIVFVNKNGTETYACKAMDGDGLMSINGNYYGFETSDIWFRFSEIFEKYGGNFF